MPKLSNLDRARALGFLEAGWTQHAVAAHFGICRKTVSRLQSRYRKTGDVKDRERSGRPRVTTQRQDRYIETTAVRKRFVTARSIQQSLNQAAGYGARRLSIQTIRNRLHASGLRARRPARRPLLTPAHREARLRWARRHRHWTMAQWRCVLFSDESRFCLRKSGWPFTSLEKTTRKICRVLCAKSDCVRRRQYYGLAWDSTRQSHTNGSPRRQSEQSTLYQ